MSKKRRKGGNPKNRGGPGRVTAKPQPTCPRRSRHAGRPLPCLHTSRRRVGDGPWVILCSWCGASPGEPPNDEITPKRLEGGPERQPVPDDWFSDEAPVIAMPMPEWRQAQRFGLPKWPKEAVDALAEELQ